MVSGNQVCSIEGMFLNDGEEFTIDCEPEGQEGDAVSSSEPVNSGQLVNLRPTGQQNYTLNLYRNFITRLNLWDAEVNFRGGDFPGDFISEQHLGNQNPANSSGTILYDQTSGLRWQSSGTGLVPFAAAVKHLETLNSANYGGRNDWRLPTSEEAASLLRAQVLDNGLFTLPEFDAEQTSMWTSDESPENNNFYMSLKDGTLAIDQTGQLRCSVRAVSGPTGGLPATAN